MQLARILVAVDFSEAARAAVRAADALAGPGTTITLMHVNSYAVPVVADWTYVMPPEELARLMTAAEEELRRWANELETEPERVRVEVVAGEPIAELTKRSDAYDLVVLGTHGRKGLPRLFLGSVAERVARLARCSVLIVRQPEARADARR